MPRVIHKLSAAKVASLTAVGLHPDGNGLYLRITKTGTKSWIYRYSGHGRTRDMGLGPLDTTTLAQARRLAAECRRLRSDGSDPIKTRDTERTSRRLAAAQTASFKECAEELIAAREAGWRNAKHRQQWPNTLRSYVYPILGELPVSEVDTELVLDVLQQQVTAKRGTASFWNAKPETASRVRGRIEAVLSWAKVKGVRVGENPAQWRGHLDQLLPTPAKVRPVIHHPALPYDGMPTLLAEIRQNASVRARALEFLILTASRTVEARGARFEEIDLEERRVWTVPASRMKGGKLHRVPLSTRGVEIVKEMTEIRLNEFVFPGMKAGRPLSDMALLMLLRELRPGITTHGFRSTFKDWASEQTSFPDHVSEAALAHVSADKVRGAYARSDLFHKRRELMEAWAMWCAPKPATAAVLPLQVRA